MFVYCLFVFAFVGHVNLLAYILGGFENSPMIDRQGDPGPGPGPQSWTY